MNEIITRGTTPTFKFNFAPTHNPANFTKAQLVFSRNGQVDLEKGLSDFTITGQTMSVQFTEAETLKLTPGEYKYQMRFGIGEQRLATPEMVIRVADILKDGAL